jgi:predicted MFS family arabinose efflux permease
MSVRAATFAAPSERPVSRAYAWSAFAILFLLMVVDYVDRQVVVSMFPHLKAQWGLTDTQLGALVSVVSIAVAAGALPLSLLADRWGRVKSIFLMAIVWSGATLACAFAQRYTDLFVARSIVGLGEAAYGTAGVALLATVFPQRMRSTILGAFLAATVLGSVLGVMLGGYISDHWGWQAGFGTVAIPGIVLAFVLIAVVRDHGGLAADGAAPAAPRMPARAIVAELLRPRTALHACLGAGFNLLVVSTMWAWLPSYLTRYYGMTPAQAGAKTALVVLLGGAGALVCSVLADRLATRNRNARLIVPAAAAVLTTLLMCFAFAVLTPGPAQFAVILMGGFVMAGSVGPTDAVVIDVVHPRLRATGASILSLARNLFGLAGGPLLAGLLSDKYGLAFAMAVVPLFCLVSAAFFMRATRTYARDVVGS